MASSTPTLNSPRAASQPMSDQSTPQQTWRVHPLRENWTRSTLLLLFLLLLFSGIYWLFQSAFVTLLSAIFVTGSLYRYFVPFQYELYEHELVVSAPFYRLIKPWSDFRSCYVDKNGVLLSPFAKPSRLENFRGTYVRFGANRSEVVDFIKSKITTEQISPTDSPPH